MSTTQTSGQESIDAIPRRAYQLGIDGDGRTHYHRPGSPHRVWVVENGDVIHDQHLGNERITAWIDHVDDHYGWREREQVEQPAGEALVETIVAGLES
ncbi:hypothetical protein C471_08445 [Halorubrum saccharovorum DSM 1137]|uniref:Uncharacterized protein n=1 Tax=Halorubrum saccharovorum DSM 1137 TaxID=1227484 RepID=M0DWX7_9EURY|nr:hypothetical protein [Halorubrum saccharovorum]ELZ39333.1 hypothetical protein C471_08445 [Halorubrum saccharovorum DSM 1137]